MKKYGYYPYFIIPTDGNYMNVTLPKPGKYVLAVSGGVDSVVLLDILRQEDGLELTIAHFDHGMREESAADRQFVERLAQGYELPFVYEEGGLGAGASEAAARAARYAFLREVQKDATAAALITAHHEDDVLETAIINLLRGTGRKGLSALGSRPDLLRPLLNVRKRELLDYAAVHDLTWREDATNGNETYLRNYVRHQLLPRFSENDRARLASILNKSAIDNQTLDEALAAMLAAQPSGRLDRGWFSQLPHSVAREVLAAWLRANDMAGFDRKTLERLVIAAKAAPAGKVFPVKAGLTLEVAATYLALAGPER